MLKLKRIKLQQFEEDKISSFSMNQIWGGCHMWLSLREF